MAKKTQAASAKASKAQSSANVPADRLPDRAALIDVFESIEQVQLLTGEWLTCYYTEWFH